MAFPFDIANAEEARIANELSSRFASVVTEMSPDIVKAALNEEAVYAITLATAARLVEATATRIVQRNQGSFENIIDAFCSAVEDMHRRRLMH